MMNFYKNLCGRKGFTLIELVAVTAMLGVLAGMLQKKECFCRLLIQLIKKLKMPN